MFGDALAGAGGMADPPYSSPRWADVYPDALSATPLSGLPLSLPIGAPVPAAIGPPVGVPGLVITRPRAAPPVRGASPIRPPAYLPQGQGMAQVQSAITQAGSASVRRTRAAGSSAKKNSGAWGFLVAVIVLLVTTGAGQKIISLITDLLQRR